MGALTYPTIFTGRADPVTRSPPSIHPFQVARFPLRTHLSNVVIKFPRLRSGEIERSAGWALGTN